MITSVIAAVIGVLVLAIGLYYFGKEKHDPESRKIYGVAAAAGAVIAVVGIAFLVI
ncbi:MAG: hypothetical protein Q4C82_05625 [Eubacteriales bacterium]|nr:hypothetical protein [Eubacteriales bacterium]